MKTLREMRKSMNMTQAELAEALDCSRESVQKWETSATPPRSVMLAVAGMAADGELAKLAEALQAALVALNGRGAQ
jgi:transcriptional regulator with XRE-family HTH domain